jgi:CHAD domain-containing protein
VAEVSQADALARRVTLFPSETVADAARKAIAFGVESVTFNRDAAASGEPEPLHQLRVASRRLRASIELFSGVIYAGQLRIYKRDIPWIAGQAGTVRECDVTAAIIKERAAKIEPELRESITPMIAALEDRRQSQHEVLYEMLDSKRFRSLVAKVSKPAIKKVGGARTLGAAAGQLIRTIARSAMRFGGELDTQAPPATFHKLRVRIKRLRYALEMFKTLGGKRHKRALARLEELQESLGQYHDVTVASEWLHQYAETSGAPPKTILAAGALIQLLARREAKLRRRCVKAWRRFERSETLRDTLDEIRSAGRLALRPVTSAEPNPGPSPAATQSEPAPQELSGNPETEREHDSTGSHPAADLPA